MYIGRQRKRGERGHARYTFFLSFHPLPDVIPVKSINAYPQFPYLPQFETDNSKKFFYLWECQETAIGDCFYGQKHGIWGRESGMELKQRYQNSFAGVYGNLVAAGGIFNV